MATAATIGMKPSQTRYHFPQLDENGRCAKSIKPYKVSTNRPCGQSRDGDRHLYYHCRIDMTCIVKSWSIEERLHHESEDH